MAADEVKAADRASERDAELAQLLAVLGDRRRVRARYSQLQAERNAEIAAQERAALEADAKAYVVGEVRAISSLAKDQSAQDDKRLLAAAQAFADEIVRVNDRYAGVESRTHNVRSVCEAVGLPVPALEAIIPPAQRKAVLEAVALVSNVRVRETQRLEPAVEWEMTARGLAATTHRTYEEILDEKARELIRRALGR